MTKTKKQITKLPRGFSKLPITAASLKLYQKVRELDAEEFCDSAAVWRDHASNEFEIKKSETTMEHVMALVETGM